MKLLSALLLLLGLVLLSSSSVPVSADCPDGGPDDDTITCNTLPGAENPGGVIDGGAGNDSIIVDDGNPNTITAGSFGICGDSANNQCGTDTVSPGDGGNDTIIINDVIAGPIYGDFVEGNGGNDLIVVGDTTVFGGIQADHVQNGQGGDDTIVIGGVVTGGVLADNAPVGGNDLVILEDGAGDPGASLDMDGGGGTDTISFRFNIEDESIFNNVQTQMSGQTAVSGTLSYNGTTYNWSNFEQLENLIQWVQNGGGTTDGGTADGGTTDGGATDGGTADGGTADGGATDGGTTDGGTADGGATDGGTNGEQPGGTTDGGTSDGGATTGGGSGNGGGSGGNGEIVITINVSAPAPSGPAPSQPGRRLNPDAGATAGVFCAPGGGIEVYGVNGALLFALTPEQIASSLSQAGFNGAHFMILEAGGQSMWALTSNELQLHDTSGAYDFIFSPLACIA